MNNVDMKRLNCLNFIDAAFVEKVEKDFTFDAKNTLAGFEYCWKYSIKEIIIDDITHVQVIVNIYKIVRDVKNDAPLLKIEFVTYSQVLFASECENKVIDFSNEKFALKTLPELFPIINEELKPIISKITLRKIEALRENEQQALRFFSNINSELVLAKNIENRYAK